MNIAGIIPARYGSTRFPGKPLIDINGKTMIRRVYEQASKAAKLAEVIVATDDERIVKEVESFGGRVVMTAETHGSGTERCAEIVERLEKSGSNFGAVINIQGDEPFLDPSQIDLLAEMFKDPQVQIATLIKKIMLPADLENPNVVKVVTDARQRALYFSRSAIPYFRTLPPDQWHKNHQYLGHVGIYAYRTKALKKIVALPEGKLEKCESLEQLRWLENGFSIHVQLTDMESISIDAPGDLSKIINI